MAHEEIDFRVTRKKALNLQTQDTIPSGIAGYERLLVGSYGNSSECVVLLHGNQVGGNEPVNDGAGDPESGWTETGLTHGAASPFEAGYGPDGHLILNAGADYAREAADAAFTLGLDDFILEGYVYLTAGSQADKPFFGLGTTGTNEYMWIGVGTDSSASAFAGDGGVGWLDGNSTDPWETTAAPINVWRHYRLTRKGSRIRAMIDGTVVLDKEWVHDFVDTVQFFIGNDSVLNSALCLVTEVRLVIGSHGGNEFNGFDVPLGPYGEPGSNKLVLVDEQDGLQIFQGSNE